MASLGAHFILTFNFFWLTTLHKIKMNQLMIFQRRTSKGSLITLGACDIKISVGDSLWRLESFFLLDLSVTFLKIIINVNVEHWMGLYTQGEIWMFFRCYYPLCLGLGPIPCFMELIWENRKTIVWRSIKIHGALHMVTWNRHKWRKVVCFVL